MRRALLLDLDDTLYEERSYVLSGFRAVARHVEAAEPGIHADRCFDLMVKHLDQHGRDRIFDRTLLDLGCKPEGGTVQELVNVYRHHEPAIALYPDVAESLDRLSASFDLA